jgi:hypothetical protein
MSNDYWTYFTAGIQAGAAAAAAPMLVCFPDASAVSARIIEVLSVDLVLTSAVATQVGLRPVSARGTPITSITGLMTTKPYGGTTVLTPLMYVDASWAVPPTYSGVLYGSLDAIGGVIGNRTRFEWPDGFKVCDPITTTVYRGFALQNVGAGASATYNMTVQWRERLRLPF